MAKLLKIMRYNTEASLNVVRHERRLRYATTFRDASEIAVFLRFVKIGKITQLWSCMLINVMYKTSFVA